MERMSRAVILRIIAIPSFVLLFLVTSAEADIDACKDLRGQAKVTACTDLINEPNQSQSIITWALESRGVAYAWDLERYEDAIQDFSGALSGGETASLLGGRCYAYQQVRKLDQALADCDRAIALDKSAMWLFLARANLRNVRKEYAEVVEDANQALLLGEATAEAYGTLGNGYLGVEEYENARASFEHAIELSSRDDVAYYYNGLAVSLYRLGLYSESKRNSILSIEKSTDRTRSKLSEFYNTLGNDYYQLGKYDESRDQYTKAIDNYIDKEKYFLSNYYANRGNALNTVGLFQDGLSDQIMAINLYPRNSDAYYYMSVSYQYLGDESRATSSRHRSMRLQINPTISISFPTDASFDDLQNGIGVQFANPAIPNLEILKGCKLTSSTEDDFYSCMVDKALPPEYKQLKSCMDEHTADLAAAAICSTGNKDLKDGYEKLKNVEQCYTDGKDSATVAGCLGKSFLGKDEQYYLDCATKNTGSYSAIAMCALSKDLTPEQQIALSCLVETGGQPHAYAACVGGQLVTREISKCWDHGIATDDGCFGPNNEIRKFYDNIDNEIVRIFGDGGEGYKLWKAYKDNVLMPGKNHEFVKFINNGLNDVKNGPGPNNEVVKAGNAIGDAVQSVGDALGF